MNLQHFVATDTVVVEYYLLLLVGTHQGKLQSRQI